MRIPPHMTKEEVTAYQEQSKTVHRFIEDEKEALQDEFGNYQLLDLPTGRVLLMPEGSPDEADWLVCYLSDPSAEARLVVDDYVPELEDTYEDTDFKEPDEQAIIDG